MPFRTQQDCRQERRLLEAARRDGDEEKYFDDLREAIDEGQLTSRDFSVRQCFEAFVDDGYEAVSSWNPRSGGGQSGVQLITEAVDTSQFSNITGQIVFSAFLEAFNNPAFIGDSLVTTVPTDLSGEKIPGISNLGDVVDQVDEGKPFPYAGVTEDWIETPETFKRGVIVGLTKEAIFFDRTGLLIGRASDVGQAMGLNKEKRILDVALGLTNVYNRKGRGTVATYADNSGDHDWDNLAASNGLTDWTDIENAELLFDGMTDPNTGEPIAVIPNTIVVPTALLHTARRIVSATEIRFGDGASNTTQTLSRNPISNYTIVSSQFVKSRTSSATTWFLGDFPGAFVYMENWPASISQAPPNSHDEFHRDIVQQWRVSERGAAGAREPRKVVKNTA